MREEKTAEKKLARWKKGGVRYPDREALDKYSEKPGWRKGARLPGGARAKFDR